MLKIIFSRIPFLVAFALLAGTLAGATSPVPSDDDSLTNLILPGKPPVQVKIGYYLLNLVSVDERTETFQADLYLSYEWQDRRLAFTPKPGEPKVRAYFESAAEDRLKEIWWPAIEYVNTAKPEITNQVLSIFADGKVYYELGISSSFRAKLDFKRFPFDEQALPIRIQSFYWQKDQMVFVVDSSRMGYSQPNGFADLSVIDVRCNTHDTGIGAWDEKSSEFAVLIKTRRNPMFYVWQVFFPVMLVMFLSCSIFFVHIENFSDRIGISLTCLLACVALQFAVSFNLPRIAYLTPIDRLFAVTYGCTAMGVLVSVAENYLFVSKHRSSEQLDRTARWLVPLLYVALTLFVVLP